jgi:hypothetical protein
LGEDPTVQEPQREYFSDTQSETTPRGNSTLRGIFLGLTNDPPEAIVEPKIKPLKPREKGPGRKKILLLAFSILLALSLIALFFLNLFPASPTTGATPSALQTEDQSGTSYANLQDNLGDPLTDPLTPQADSTEKLVFVPDQTRHHYRKNASAGNILIVMGRISNGYPEQRSYIQVRGFLKNREGTVVAQRDAFAGNSLSEQELITLPMSEILSRLQIRAGQNSANLNILPGDSVPFMLVFDKLPADLAEYVVECVSSTPAGPAPSQTPPVI